MRKIKKMVLGLALAVSVFVCSAGSCFAATSNITVEVTSSRVVGKFEYGEAGHQIKVTVNYLEKDSSGYLRIDDVSDTQFGNVTTAYVSRANSAGWKYVSANAVGFVDGVEKAYSGEAYA